MTRTGILALGVLLMAAAPAAAADLDEIFDRPGGDWAGAYLGAHVGFVGAQFNNNVPAAPGPVGDAASPLGGIHAGYNWQDGRYVYGGEADVSFLDIDASSAGGSFEEDMMATFRARGGYAFDRYLLYVTLGLALTNKETTLTGTGSSERLEAGVTTGIGLEMFYSGNWTARIEYLFAHVPKDTQTVGGVPTNGGSDNHIARIGVSYNY